MLYEFTTEEAARVLKMYAETRCAEMQSAVGVHQGGQQPGTQQSKGCLGEQWRLR